MKKTILLTLTSIGLIAGAGMACAGPQPWDSKITHIQISSDRGGIQLSTNKNQPGQGVANPWPKIHTALNVHCNPSSGKCGTLYHNSKIVNGEKGPEFKDTGSYPSLTVEASSIGPGTAQGTFTTNNNLPAPVHGVGEIIGSAPGQQCDSMYNKKIKLTPASGASGNLYLCVQN